MKKITSLLLLCTLLASFASCASDSGNTADTTAVDAAETTTAVETEPAEYTAPDVDYGGADFIVAASQWDPGSMWRLDDYCEIYAEEENGDPINDAVYQRNRKVEEELNVKLNVFQIKSQGSTTEISTAILAGDDMFKAASTTGSSLPHFLSAGGMLTDLYDLATFDIEASWWDKESVEEFDLFGTSYAVTGDFNFYNKGAPICNFFSKKLIEDLKLDDPYEKVRDGKWTIDEMFAYATAAARDIDGDGKMDAEADTWGIMSEGSSMVQFIRGAGQRLSERDANGDITIVVNTEKTASIVEKVIPFLRDKNVNMYSGDYASQYKNVFTDLYLKRFIDNGAMFYCNQILVALNLRDMEADFGILPMPKYDEAQDSYYGTTNNAWHTFIIIPVTNGELDMTGIVLNALGYYSQQIVTPAFIDQTVMSKAIRDNDSAEMIEMIYAMQDYDIAQYYNWGNVNSMFSSMLHNSKTSFASEYAAIEPNIETKLAETIAQLKE